MRHYPTMSVAQVAALPVADLAADHCTLFLWITGPFLAIGAHLPVMKAWGFKPSGMGFAWVKLNPKAATLFVMPSDIAIGGGFTTRKNAEFCLIGRRGKPPRHSASVHEVIISPRREHSRKPDEYRDRVERYVGPGIPIVELFARESRPGWTTWGNEAQKFDAPTG